jgi:hypothetical protein
MQRSALPGSADERSEATDDALATDETVATGETVATDETMATGPAAPDLPAESESIVVHVQLRPRRGATRKCLAALASLAAEHPAVAFAVTGLSKDDRVVRVTVGVDLGPRLGVAKFSPQAQAAYAFVSAIFTALYEHMPVYTAEPAGAERAAAATLLDSVSTGRPAIEAEIAAEIEAELGDRVHLGDGPLPAPRSAGWGERVSA